MWGSPEGRVASGRMTWAIVRTMRCPGWRGLSLIRSSYEMSGNGACDLGGFEWQPQHLAAMTVATSSGMSPVFGGVGQLPPAPPDALAPPAPPLPFVLAASPDEPPHADRHTTTTAVVRHTRALFRFMSG